MQDLADIDIAKPRDDTLIQKRGLDRHPPPLQPRDQVVLVKRIAQGLRPEVAQEPMRVPPGGRHQVHRPEPARIVEGDARAVVEIQHDMVMLFRRRMGVVERAGCIARNQDAARHAQMDQKRLIRGQIGKDVFRPPRQPQDPRARQPPGHAFGQRKAQVGAPDVGCHDHPPLDHGHQAAAHGFHFGQFGHVAPAIAPHCHGGQGPYKEGEFA